MIEHHLPDGRKVWSQYAHLHERWVSAGEIVWRRQPIGTVGADPNTFSPHLHFEIRSNTSPKMAGPGLMDRLGPRLRCASITPIHQHSSTNRPAK